MDKWQTFCASFTIFVMMAIFICYTILPEYKNLHGLIFRSYLATYIIANMILLMLEHTDISKTWLGQICSAAIFYIIISVVLWLNVMSFNIWKTFRVMQSTNIHVDESEKKKFIYYAIYAWGIPIVLGTINGGIYHFEKFLTPHLGTIILLSCTVGIISGVCISNIFMFTWTAIRIKRLKNETSHLADGVNKHSKIHKQWLNLYLKLFIIMGGHLIVWPLSISLPVNMSGIIITSEMISTILTFFICIWKEDVKRSFCKQFTKILHRLQKSFRPLRGRDGNPETRLNADPHEPKFNDELNSEAISNIYTITTENVSA